jgi:hypothetical protein
VYIHQQVPQITTGTSTDVVIEEKPEATVPTLQVRNVATTPLLLVEGETVDGGMQNRVLNVSVLIPAGTTIDIPVSCVEQGRWGGGGDFGRDRTFATRRVRREKTHSVAESVIDTGLKRSDQGSVWSAVHSELQRLDVTNSTGAIAEVQAVLSRDHRLADAAAELGAGGPLPGQCGVVVSHGTKIVAADIFAQADALACHWEAIVRSHLLDTPKAIHGRPSVTRAIKFPRSSVQQPIG